MMRGRRHRERQCGNSGKTKSFDVHRRFSPSA
jgi:hypothetical protein